MRTKEEIETAIQQLTAAADSCWNHPDQRAIDYHHLDRLEISIEALQWVMGEPFSLLEG
jgi:hypothetical protein